ncbi:MAG: hypothetical protein AB8H86_13270 [Polyangiales bacterium]
MDHVAPSEAKPPNGPLGDEAAKEELLTERRSDEWVDEEPDGSVHSAGADHLSGGGLLQKNAKVIDDEALEKNEARGDEGGEGKDPESPLPARREVNAQPAGPALAGAFSSAGDEDVHAPEEAHQNRNGNELKRGVGQEVHSALRPAHL